MFPFQFTVNGNETGALVTLAIVLMTLVNFAMAVFWIVVGWRAMKAHERLPETLASGLRSSETNPARDVVPPIGQA